MRILNEGLSKADALIIVPVYQVCWVIMNTVVGMVYFEDYRDMPGANMALFLLGVVITLLGVYLLSDRNVEKLQQGEALKGSSRSEVVV